MLRHLVFAWVLKHGYVALSALLMLGIVGLPVPDETLLLFSGYLVYRGHFHLLPALFAAIGGSMVGITVSYALGRTLGHQVVVRYGRLVHLDAARYHRVADWFNTRGRWTLAVGYYVPGFRHVVALVAGAAEMPYRPFAAYAYAGAVVWCATFILLGRAFGPEWEWLGEQIRRHLLVVSVLIAVGLVAYGAVRRVARRAGG